MFFYPDNLIERVLRQGLACLLFASLFCGVNPTFGQGYDLVKKWGSLGVSEGQFNSPSSISYDPSNESIYVADLENNRIQKFDTDGNFLMKWGLSGTNNGEFYHPGDIESDSSGNLYVADIDNARIQKFDSEGNFLMKWGSTGKEDG
jgi:DNA-binding beta-propeller fold protein YncE